MSPAQAPLGQAFFVDNMQIIGWKNQGKCTPLGTEYEKQLVWKRPGHNSEHCNRIKHDR